MKRRKFIAGAGAAAAGAAAIVHAPAVIAQQKYRRRMPTTWPPAEMADLNKLAADVVRDEANKSPTARKVHTSFTKLQARPGGWCEISEGAFHQFVAL